MNIAAEIRKKWKRRPADSHKGDYGRVLIAAGSLGMHGAAHLAGMAALRSGAGLVSLAVPERIYGVVAKRESEIMVKPLPATREGSLALRALAPLKKMLRGQDVLAIGPGLSQNPQTVKLLRRLLPAVKLPVVLDADALNAFARQPRLLQALGGRAVLTPHPGEFVRLFGAPKLVQGGLKTRAGRAAHARKAARQTNAYVILKGHQTVVAAPDGRVYFNPSGNAGMATAGSGDVLSGILAAVIGQHFSLWDAARFSVYLHGLAGDLAARKKGEISLTAGDLIDFLPAAFKRAGAGR